MRVIPYGKMYIPFGFNHVDNTYTNRRAFCFSLIPLLFILLAAIYELNNVGHIKNVKTKWTKFLD